MKYDEKTAIFDGRPSAPNQQIEVTESGKIKLILENGEVMFFDSREQIQEHIKYLNYGDTYKKSELIFS